MTTAERKLLSREFTGVRISQLPLGFTLSDAQELWRCMWDADPAAIVAGIGEAVESTERPAADREDDARDAARYRWLQHNGSCGRGDFYNRKDEECYMDLDPASLDAAIDAALAASGAKGKS